jgi:hypothetical protein
VAWVRDRTITRPSDRRLSTKLVPNFAARGSERRIYGRNLGFLERSRYFLFQVAPQLCSRGWVGPGNDYPTSTTQPLLKAEWKKSEKSGLSSSSGLQLLVDGRVGPTIDVQNYKVNRTVLLASSTVKNNTYWKSPPSQPSAYQVTGILQASGTAVHVFIQNSVAWFRERTIPTDRPPVVGELSANFCRKRMPGGQCDGSLRPYSRLSRLEPLLFLSSSSSAVLKRLSWHRSRPTTF